QGESSRASEYLTRILEVASSGRVVVTKVKRILLLGRAGRELLGIDIALRAKVILITGKLGALRYPEIERFPDLIPRSIELYRINKREIRELRSGADHCCSLRARLSQIEMSTSNILVVDVTVVSDDIHQDQTSGAGVPANHEIRPAVLT